MNNAFSGVGARLALALLVVLAGAWALVYLIVVPSLESRLVDARVSALGRAAPGIARELPADRFRWPDFVEAASASANARVVVYDTVGPPTALVVAGDSQGFRSSDVQADPIALRTAERRVAKTGTTTHDGERFAEAAAPVPGSSSVVLVSSSLHEAEATARVARERLLLAGAARPGRRAGSRIRGCVAVRAAPAAAGGRRRGDRRGPLRRADHRFERG